MPSPYKPPLMRRAQAVQSASGHARPRVRWAWLVPLVGLLPVVVAAVLASEGRFGSPTPRAAGPGAAAPASTAIATGTPVATDGVAGAAATRSTAGLTPTAIAATRSSDASGAPTATAGQGQTRAGAAPSVQTAPPAQAAPTAQAAAAPATDRSVVSSPNALAAQTSPATGPFRSYRVQPGDTVKLIAETYGVSAMSIAQASGLRDADRLRIGQVLTIPSQPGWLYRIKPGETLDQIAARTGIPTDLILSASQRADGVGAGDVILIPDQLLAPGK